MKKKIGILGSTGSIGSNLLRIIDKKNTKVVFLLARKNYKKIFSQAEKFNVKNIIITDNKSFENAIKNNKNKSFNIFNSNYDLEKIIKKKLDYVMSSITGIEGLKPTFDIIKYTKKIAIANKEAIVCGWKFIDREIKKNKTIFIPIDSEHFSIWYALKGVNKNLIKKIFLTASGGPFLKKKASDLKNIKLKDALVHPNWKMGKKISIDSSTMMNKVFEIIEAKNIFKIPYSKLSILVHPKSYIHAIIIFKDGMIKLVAHKTSMLIPIFNSLLDTTVNDKKLSSFESSLNIKILNNLDLSKIKASQFNSVKILNLLPNQSSLFETAVITANDELVKSYIDNKIRYHQIISHLLNFLKKKEIIKLKRNKNFTLKELFNLNKYVRITILKNIYKNYNDLKI